MADRQTWVILLSSFEHAGELSQVSKRPVRRGKPDANPIAIRPAIELFRFSG